MKLKLIITLISFITITCRHKDKKNRSYKFFPNFNLDFGDNNFPNFPNFPNNFNNFPQMNNFPNSSNNSNNPNSYSHSSSSSSNFSSSTQIGPDGKPITKVNSNSYEKNMDKNGNNPVQFTEYKDNYNRNNDNPGVLNYETNTNDPQKQNLLGNGQRTANLDKNQENV
jgi:hypothetical protein